MSDNFWGDALDENLTGEFSVGGGDIEPMPGNTVCLAAIDEAKWDADKDGNQFISLRWSMLQPEAYKNRKVFQKLWVKDPDPRAKDVKAKRDKALRMLGAIDKNAGGKLATNPGEPSDLSLASALLNKPMFVTIMRWNMKADDGGEDKVGNWIQSVAPRTAGAKVPEPAKVQSGGSLKKAVDDNIPFARCD